MFPILPVVLLFGLTGADEPPATPPHFQAVAPFVGDETAAVAHLDLSRLEIESLARGVLGRFTGEDEAAEVSRTTGQWVAALRKAGANDLFLVLDAADIPGPPVAVVPLADGADAKTIGQLLCGGGPVKPPYSWPTCATIHGAVFAGTPDVLDRVRGAKPTRRGDLTAALSSSGDAPALLLIVPSANQRRVVEELVPTLPQELGGGAMTAITRDLRWASVALGAGAKPTVRVVVQSRNPASAAVLNRLFLDALKLLSQAAHGPSMSPEFAKAIADLKPRVVDDRVVLKLDLERASDLVGVPSLAAREASRRRQCTENLLQIGIAMHNYLHVHKTFPPAFRTDAQGRPLLSWRVLLLPYLDQDALYKEFHLDEPWDSPHNKALIARIPPTFVCPSAKAKLRAEGMTTYLVPRGKATMYPGGEPVKLNEVTDGTSNTILAVDAGDDRAVVWTQPGDWEVDPEHVKDRLFGHHPEGTIVLNADGSVKFQKATIRPATLRALLTRNGGEVVDPSDP